MTQADVLERPDLASREMVDECLKNGQYGEAAMLLATLIKENPDDPVLLNALGTAKAGEGDFAGAEKELTKAVAIDSRFADAYYNLGLARTRQGRVTDAVEAFLMAVKINPQDAAAHNDLGAIYYSQGKSLLARGHFIKALESDPLFKNALLNLVDICWESGSQREALGWIKKSLEAVGGKDQGEVNFAPITIGKAAIEKGTDPSFVPSPPKIQDRRKPQKKSSEVEDIFLKHVPQELRSKKTGMNIAIVADFNIAGQLSLLQRMINKYTIHKARLVILQGDYLSYDKDLILSGGKMEDYYEARDLIRSADFYHIGRFPVNFGEVDWGKILRPDNSVVQYYGSEIRWNAEPIFKWHERSGIMGISCWDYTMIKNAPLFYHINIACDLARIRPCEKPGDMVRICHPPTNRVFKKTDLFLSVMEELKGKYPVEVELIEGKSNEECLELKSRCHITYDQVSVGIYGLSAIESMAAGHAVLCGISNFASSYHPDNPIVYVHENNLKEKIEHLLLNKDEITKAGEAGIEWARRHHDSKRIVRQIAWLYDLAQNGHRLVDDRDDFMLK